MTVNWGILGASKFAKEQMGPAIHRARGARLYAVASRSPAKINDFRAFAPDVKSFESYEGLIADPDVDAIYIPLPNHIHVEWALKALSAGKHVLCEKPLAMSAEDFAPVIELRDKTGLVAAEAYMIVHHPQWQMTRDLVQRGEIGTLAHVDAAFSYNNAKDTGNIRNFPETGGGSIPDIGVYTIGSTRFVTGCEPIRVLNAEITWENGVDTTARISAEFPGFSFSSLTSMRLAPRQEMVFHGTTGLIRLTAPFNPQVFGEAQVHLETGQGTQSWRFPAVNHYVNQVENFGAAIAGDAEFLCPLEFSQGTQKMIDEVFKVAGK